MLPAPGPASSLLLPAKAQLTAAALREYRELLRKTRSNKGDESGSLFQQAKERVLLRLRQPRPRHDPKRAFSRLRDQWAAARLSLRDLKNEQKERLRQYVAAAVGSSSSSATSSPGKTSGSAGSLALAAAKGQQPVVVAAAAGNAALDAHAAAAAMGSNGPLRHLVIAAVGGTCKLFLQAGARTSVEGSERMAAALARPPGQGLITVSNHVGSIDDPLITTSIVPADKLLDPAALRWTLCATDRCFKRSLLVPFFRAAKVLPVERGAGLSQFGMQLAQSRLAGGEWVHIFPEGTRSRDGRMLPVRKGVGWLVASAAASGGQPPMVLPFVHSGMENVLPKGRTLPKLGQELRVLVGEPIAVDDLLRGAAAEGWSEEKLHVAIADRVGQALYQLKAQLDGLPLEAVAPQRRAARVSISEDTLLPLIEGEMDSLAHRWQDRWQRLSLPSLTQRMRGAVAARREALRARLAAAAAAAAGDSLFATDGSGGEASFEGIAAATEEGLGVISGWEHAVAAPLPWMAPSEAEEAAWEAAAVAPASRSGMSALPEAAQQGAGPGSEAGLLAGQWLHLLRGGARSEAALGSSGSAGSIPGAVAALEASQDFLAASPLDAARAVAPAEPDSSGLPALLAATASYSAARMQHMRGLLAVRGNGRAAPELQAASL